MISRESREYFAKYAAALGDLKGNDVVPYDLKVAIKANLTIDEIIHWENASLAKFGSYLDPFAYGKKAYLNSAKNPAIMKKLKDFHSEMVRTDRLRSEEEKERNNQHAQRVDVWDEALKVLNKMAKKIEFHEDWDWELNTGILEEINQTCGVLNEIEVFLRNNEQISEFNLKRIETLQQKAIHRIDYLVKFFLELEHDDSLAYMENLLKIQIQLRTLLDSNEISNDIFRETAKTLQFLNDFINSKTSPESILTIDNPQTRYQLLLKLQQSRKPTDFNLKDALNKANVARHTEDIFQMRRFGEKDNFIRYFLGIPKDRGNTPFFVLNVLLYTVGLGFIFTPLKNILTIFTEYAPKRMQLFLEDKSSFLSDIAKGIWLLGRSWTSPVVSFKAALQYGTETNNKRLGRALGLLSLFSSGIFLVAVMVTVPKAIIGVLGQAGGVFASINTFFTSTMKTVSSLPNIGFSYLTPTVVVPRKQLGKIVDKRSTKYIHQKLDVQKFNTVSEVHRDFEKQYGQTETQPANDRANNPQYAMGSSHAEPIINYSSSQRRM